MNWQKIYDDLCRSRKSCQRATKGCEKHHIIPRSLGGSDRLDNIVKLTIREHVIAHMLLERIYRGRHGHHSMVVALHRILYKSETRLSTRQVERLREMLGDAMRRRQNEIMPSGLTRAQEQNRVQAKKRRDKTRYEFYHADHGKVTASPSELAERHTVRVENLFKIVDRLRMSDNGWYLYEHHIKGLTLEVYEKFRRLQHSVRLKNRNGRSLKIFHKDYHDLVASEQAPSPEHEELEDPLVRVPGVRFKTCVHCGTRGSGSFMVENHMDRCPKRPKPKKTACEHCLKEVDPGNYALSHGPRCRASPTYEGPPVIKNVWVTDGSRNARVAPDELDLFLEANPSWRAGSTQKRKRT